MPILRLSAPFVVTAAVCVPACSGTAVVDGGAGGAASSTSRAASTSSTTAGGASVTSTVASSGGAANPVCPSTVPGTFEQCDADTMTVCSYMLSCQSGSKVVGFVCRRGFWTTAIQPCDWNADSCPGTELYCQNGQWYLPEGTNPPAPCPEVAPGEGTDCDASEMGGTWFECGYACDGTDAVSGWTVASCQDTTGDSGSWQYDGKCDGG